MSLYFLLSSNNLFAHIHDERKSTVSARELCSPLPLGNWWHPQGKKVGGAEKATRRSRMEPTRTRQPTSARDTQNSSQSAQELSRESLAAVVDVKFSSLPSLLLLFFHTLLQNVFFFFFLCLAQLVASFFRSSRLAPALLCHGL